MALQIDEFFYLSTMEIRACLNLYRKTGITNKQIEILYGFSTYMLLRKRKSVGIKDYCNWSGSGPAMARIIKSQLKGLIDKGAVHSVAYRNRPKSFETFVLSEFGCRILESYEKEIHALNAKYKDRDLKAGYRSLTVHSSKLEEVLPLYIAGPKGRDE